MSIELSFSKDAAKLLLFEIPYKNALDYQLVTCL